LEVNNDKPKKGADDEVPKNKAEDSKNEK